MRSAARVDELVQNLYNRHVGGRSSVHRHGMRTLLYVDDLLIA